MIVRYGDQAANERTFLAWVRTGIAVIVFGFAIWCCWSPGSAPFWCWAETFNTALA